MGNTQESKAKLCLVTDKTQRRTSEALHLLHYPKIWLFFTHRGISMTLKSVIFTLVLMAVSSALAFVAGQSYKHLQTTANLTTSIEGLRSDLRALEKELAKQTGITLPANRQDTASQEGLEKADALLKQGAVAKAGLYFSNAISQDPGNWSVIQRYHQSLLSYCQQVMDQGQFDTALTLLADVETFLRTQTIHLKTADLTYLEQALTDLAKLRQTITDTQVAKTRQETEQRLTPLLAKTEEILAKPTTTGESQALTVLQETLAGLQAVDTTGLNDSQVTTVQEKIASLEKQLTALESATSQEANAANLKTLVQRTQQFIDQAIQEPSQSEFILYYLTSAETMIRQLVLAAPEMATVKQPVAELTQRLEEAKETIAKAQSQAVWAEIEQAYNQIKIDEKTKAQDDLNQLLPFRQLLGEKASKLSSMEFLEKARTMMEKVNKAIENTQKAQLRLYDQWAVKQVHDFYQSYKNELGTGTDENRVYEAILSYLGDIDMRYLSTPAQTAYNEAFGMFYAELNSEQKIPLSAEMTLKEKKPLTDF
jgi:tetratricopeptide (TPR) repeat protein